MDKKIKKAVVATVVTMLMASVCYASINIISNIWQSGKIPYTLASIETIEKPSNFSTGNNTIVLNITNANGQDYGDVTFVVALLVPDGFIESLLSVYQRNSTGVDAIVEMTLFIDNEYRGNFSLTIHGTYQEIITLTFKFEDGQITEEYEVVCWIQKQ